MALISNTSNNDISDSYTSDKNKQCKQSTDLEMNDSRNVNNEQRNDSKKHGGKIKICFVALSCYSLISRRSDIAHIGGAEVQQWLIARWLQEQGYDVSFVTHDHGQADGEKINGFTVYKAYNSSAGLPVLRFFHPRWSGIWAAMSRADADVYYQRGAGVESGQVASWCRLNKKKYIFASASDADCSRDLRFLPEQRERLLYRLGLAWSDATITQTGQQQQLMAEHFQKTSTVLRNCGSRARSVSGVDKDSNVVLWVGRFSPEKRLEWLLDVAEICRDYQFEIVGDANYKNQYAQDLLARSEKMSNVNIRGRVSHSEMDAYYSRCKVLTSTSVIEGFPNVYIEAWSMGIPVLTTFDPDGVIQASGAGWVRGSVEQFVDTLQSLRSDPQIWDSASQASRRYYDENHTLEKNMPVFEQVIHQARS